MSRASGRRRVFVTVGAQIPFDRLVAAVDCWLADRSDVEAFAQIGEGGWAPLHMPHASLLTPSAFRQRVQWADVIVAHAGMGSLITAMQYGKPIVVMPRFGRLKETRNDHQVATAERFRTLPTVAVAMDASELAAALERTDLGSGGTRIGSAACSELIDAVRDVVIGTRASPPRR